MRTNLFSSLKNLNMRKQGRALEAGKSRCLDWERGLCKKDEVLLHKLEGRFPREKYTQQDKIVPGVKQQ
jgi:hypothetical protein